MPKLYSNHEGAHTTGQVLHSYNRMRPPIRRKLCLPTDRLGLEGFRVLGFRVQGFRALGFRVQGFRVLGLGLQGFWVLGFQGFRASWF